MELLSGIPRFCMIMLLGLAAVIAPTGARAVDQASINATNMPGCMEPGETRDISVSVTNTGSTTWSSTPPSPPPGCSRPDNCPVRLSYHWEGPMNVHDGIRSDIAGTVSPGASQTIRAQLRVADTRGAGLPVGMYTLKWQMLHTGMAWMPVERAYSVEVRNSCLRSVGAVDFCERYPALCGFIAMPLAFAPVIDRVEGNVTPTAAVRIRGRFLGDAGGHVRLLSGGRTIELPVTLWSPADIVVRVPEVRGMQNDPGARLQVETSGRFTAEITAPFTATLERKILPNIRVQYCGSQPSAYDNCDGNQTTLYSCHVQYSIFGIPDRDEYVADLRNGWVFDSMRCSPDGNIRGEIWTGAGSSPTRVDVAVRHDVGGWSSASIHCAVTIRGPMGVPHQ